jgi:hypothetical protein
MHETAQGLYHSLENQRWSFLDRGRTSSELTLPYVLPPDGHNYATKYYTPYQGIGARGVLLNFYLPYYRLTLRSFVW